MVIDDLKYKRNHGKEAAVLYEICFSSGYAVWRERNKIIHGDKLLPLTTLKRMIDKWIRNKITLMRNHGVKGTGELMQFWFFTRV